MADKDVADVLVIGSGASGAAFAWSLSRVQGIKIVCLEQGEWSEKSPTDGVASANAIERLTKRPALPGVKYHRNGYPFDRTHSHWEPVLGNTVGGGTVHYAAAFGRLRPTDFLIRSLTGVGDDWPIRYEDLAPFYDLNDDYVGVAGQAGNPAYPNSHAKRLPLPNPPDAQLARLYREWLDRMGWSYFPIDRAIITVPFNGRDPRNVREAKNRADVVHWPTAIKNGVVLKTRATVREITVNKQGLADGVLYFDAKGHVQEQKARVVVVACNGIGTARLLLNSKSARFPHGLANTSGLVGKGLMGHPTASVTAEFDATEKLSNNLLEHFVGADPLVAVEEFADVRQRGGAIGGFTFTGAAHQDPVAAALGIRPESVATTIPASFQSASDTAGRSLPWGRAHHGAFQQRVRGTVTSSIIASELAEPANRVELHPTLTDDFGTPAPAIFYSRSENTSKLLDYAIERVTQLMRAAGATSVSGQYATSAPGHYLGTARMGVDAEQSVVDKWCRAHDVRNLFIIDGSVFVTSGTRVPTSTIQAIAVRTADYVKSNAGRLPKS